LVGKGAGGLIRFRSGLVKGVDKVGEIREEDIDVMITTNVIGLIGVCYLFLVEMVTRADTPDVVDTADH
jgi:3-hydroxy acid dehydrogenase/malonic semialdehyde reductase